MPVILGPGAGGPGAGILAYTTYVPDVLIYAPGAPQLTIVDALRKSARQFFYESLAFRAWLDPFDLTINVSTYDLDADLPVETDLAQIMLVNCDNLTIDEATHDEFLRLDPKWPTLTGTNPSYYTALNHKGHFSITPVPTATITNAFNVQVAVYPSLASTGIEQGYFEEFKDGIIDGALSRLLAMPDRPWTDVKMAVVRLTDFQRQVLFAKIQASKGNVRRDVMVQMRRWV
jgi:hypothetical protein